MLQASNFNALGGAQWSIKTADGIKITHDQDFFYSDHSDTLGDSAEELLLYNNARVDIHEAIHTWGHKGHDTDPLWLAILRCHRQAAMLISIQGSAHLSYL